MPDYKGNQVIESEVVKLENTSATYDILVEKEVPETNPDFYIFTRKQILEATTPTYRQFLKEAGYADIDNCKRLEIAKGVLKKDNKYVVNFNHPDARELVEGTGHRILTTQLMYSLFIPYLKEEAENDNVDAQKTLEEMINNKNERLEGLIIGNNKLKINSKEIKISLVEKTGPFNRNDLNEFGYPNKLTDNGEFYFGWSESNEKAAFRGGGYSGLDLILTGPEGVIEDDVIGVRLSKFIK